MVLNLVKVANFFQLLATVPPLRRTKANAPGLNSVQQHIRYGQSDFDNYTQRKNFSPPPKLI